MPDNPFEHEAKQKLDELNFTPSDAVWQKVEAQIKKDKNRRRLLIWLPLFCVLMGAGCWYFISGKSNPLPAKEVIAIPHQDKNKADSFSIQRTPLNAEASAAVEKNNTRQGAGENHAAGAVPKENKKTYKKPKRTPGTGIRFSTQPVEKTYSAGIRGQRQTPDTYFRNAENTPAITPMNSASRNTENNTKDSTSHNADNNKTDHPSANPAAGGKPDSADRQRPTDFSSAHRDSLNRIARNKTASGRKSKIEWGITAGPGFSSVSEKFIQDSYLAPAPVNLSSGINWSGLPSAKQSFAYFAGLMVKKPLNNTMSIFTGIRYTYSAIKISRGNPVNLPMTVYGANNYSSNIADYYSAAAPGHFNYTSHYHFLEIPLGIEKQFGQKSRFSANAGISFARLLATNALQFDPQYGIYYKDDSYFNKTQWNILGSIQYSLLEKKKYTLRIGPQVQYGLTSLLNKKSLYSEHLFFGGIQLLLLSNRK